MSWLILILVVFVIYLALRPAQTRKRSTHTVTESGNRVFYMQVHGITHENADGTNRQRIINDCCLGEEVCLIPEPTNPCDPGAVKVCRRNGEQIGYWPADGRMAHDLKIGWTYKVTIDEIFAFEEDHRKHGVRLRVEVLTMSRKTEARKSRREYEQLNHGAPFLS